MHELSIAMSLLDAAAAEARRHSGAVAALHVRVGPLAGVVKQALLAAYDLAREASELPNARLVVEDVPLVVYCPACQAQRELTAAVDFSCPQCGTATPTIISGRELELVALEMES